MSLYNTGCEVFIILGSELLTICGPLNGWTFLFYIYIYTVIGVDNYAFLRGYYHKINKLTNKQKTKFSWTLDFPVD